MPNSNLASAEQNEYHEAKINPAVIGSLGETAFTGTFLELWAVPFEEIRMDGNSTGETTPATGTTPRCDGPPDAGQPDYIAESPPKRLLP